MLRHRRLDSKTPSPLLLSLSLSLPYLYLFCFSLSPSLPLGGEVRIIVTLTQWGFVHAALEEEKCPSDHHNHIANTEMIL